MERTKEEELRIVLKNYDKVKAERDALRKENEELKAKLAQQEILYKNMLMTYSERPEIMPKKWNGEKIRTKFTDLNAKYGKLKEVFKKQQAHIEIKAEKINKLADENIKMKNMLDSLRGAICGAHNKADSFCDSLGISNRADDCLNQVGEEVKSLASAQECPNDLKTFQQQKFIKYIRDMVVIYRNTGTLSGIATLAQGYGVAALTKVKFFQYHLDDVGLTDEKILAVYEEIKKRKGVV